MVELHFAQNTNHRNSNQCRRKIQPPVTCRWLWYHCNLYRIQCWIKSRTVLTPDNRNLLLNSNSKKRNGSRCRSYTNKWKDGFKKYGNFSLNILSANRNSAQTKFIKTRKCSGSSYSKKNRLKVLANDPILIENRKLLATTSNTSLDSFAYAYETQVAVYTGGPLFEEMTPANNGQLNGWITEKAKAYRIHPSFHEKYLQPAVREEGFWDSLFVSTETMILPSHQRTFMLPSITGKMTAPRWYHSNPTRTWWVFCIQGEASSRVPVG